jgi:hypothetical protein
MCWMECTQIKNKLTEWAALLNEGRKPPGERHKPLIMEELRVLSEEAAAVGGGWSSITCVRVRGKNYQVEGVTAAATAAATQQVVQAGH